ncbi:MAG: hypothetical protein R3E66_14640 [bacterium]
MTTFDGHTSTKRLRSNFRPRRAKLVAGFPDRQVSPGSQPKIVLRFDQPVDAAKLFEGLKASIPLELLDPSQTPDDVNTKDWRDGTWVVVQPANGLPADAEIKLTLKKGTACGLGQRTTTEDQGHTFHTAGVFKVRTTDGSGESPTTWWTFHFTNDVDTSSYKNSDIVCDPPFPAHASSYSATLSLYGLRDSRTTYRVTLPESMRDVHGQLLQGQRTFTFKTTAGWPSLEGPNQQLVTLPVGSNAAFQLRSMEYARLSVSVYAVDPSDYPDFWSKYYDCLYNEGTPPGVLHSTQILDIESPEKWTESKVDLPADIPHMIVIAEPKISPFAAIKERVTGSRRPRTIHWVQRTNLAATTRFDQNTGHVLVTQISDAQPQADVELWGDGIKVATTDLDGHAQWQLSAQHMLLRRGDDTCVIDGHMVANYHHAQNQRFHVFSDRGLYKPGESARIKVTRTVDLDRAAFSGRDDHADHRP